MTYAIEIEGLGKKFVASQGYRDLLPGRRGRSVEALKDINLQVPQGEVFGLLGTNGAGKTTLLKILGTLILPTSGHASVLGEDVVQEPEFVKDVLTYVVSEDRSFYWRLTGRQNLQYFAALNNIPGDRAKTQINELLSLLQLEEASERRVMYYSTGMRQKLALARGMLTDPDILLLDEPARSIDPIMAGFLWEFMRRELVDRLGKTILLATHNLDEAQRVCDRVAVLNQGEVQASGSVEELIQIVRSQHRYSLTLHPCGDGVEHMLSKFPGVKDVYSVAQDQDGPVSYNFSVENPDVQVPVILEGVIAAACKVLACQAYEPSLNDVLAVLSKENS